MNIVFFGSSKFAIPSLKALNSAGHNILSVVTQPDKRMGRHLHLESPVVKKLAAELKLKTFQPQNINSVEALNFLKDLDADLFVVISYGQILSKEALNLPKKIAINSHASILPKYRGAAPINWAIIRGEKITGVSIIKMTEKMDAGEVILVRESEILEDDTSIALGEKLSALAAGLLLEALPSIEKNNYKLMPQDESKVTFAPKLKKENGLINWESPAEDIYNLIRGCLAWPGAFTYYKGKMLKIYKARVNQFPLQNMADQPSAEVGEPACPEQGRRVSRLPGEIMQVSKEGVIVAAAEDSLIIEELQIEGKRRMAVKEFIAGHKIFVGEILM